MEPCFSRAKRNNLAAVLHLLKLAANPDPAEDGFRERWASTLQRAAYAAFPRLAAATLEIRAAELGAPSFPQLFSTDLREIPPGLNEELVDLYGRSEQLLANHFSFFKRPEALAAQFDWEAFPSPAWRQELHAFDYGLSLALTYRISRDQRYARHLRYLMAHWIGQNPAGGGTGWRVVVLARRIRNWILAADLAREDWEREPVFFEIVAQSLALQCAFLLDHAPNTGFPIQNLHVARGLLLAARFFSERGREKLQRKGSMILADAFENCLTQNGTYSDPRPLSQLQLAEAAVEFCLFHIAAGSRDEALARSKSRQILEGLESFLLPDGTLPRWGSEASSAAEALSNLFALAAVLFDQPRWKSLAGQFGIVPYLALGEGGWRRFKELPQQAWSAPSAIAPERSLYRLSGSNHSAIVINARLPKSRNDHQDFLSYELMIEGHRVIVDSGASVPDRNRLEEDLARAQAHNLLLVDGRGPRFRPLHPRPSVSARGLSGPDQAGLLVVDPILEFMGVAHSRAWFCLGRKVWVVLDRLEGSGIHKLQNVIHLYPTFAAEVGKSQATLASRALVCTVIPLPEGQHSITVTRGADPALPGFYAPEPGVLYEASVLSLEVRRASLPWLGGYVIIPGPAAAIRAAVADPVRGLIGFEHEDRRYTLAFGADGGHPAP